MKKTNQCEQTHYLGAFERVETENDHWRPIDCIDLVGNSNWNSRYERIDTTIAGNSRDCLVTYSRSSSIL